MTPPIQRTNSFSGINNLNDAPSADAPLHDDTNVQTQSNLGNRLNPQDVPQSPRNAIVQCLKGEKVPSELNLKAPPEGKTAQEQKRAVADTVAKIAARLAQGVPQQADTLGFTLGDDSFVELRTDGEGGVFISVDGGKEARIDAHDIPGNLGERLQADQNANAELYSQQTDLPAQTKAVVDAFADLVSGKKVPSQMTIVDPVTGRTSPKMKLDLAKAAVKLSTALMFMKPGTESMMGFTVGDSTIELRRDNFGSFFISIDGSSERKVPVDDVKLGLANNLAKDMLTHSDIYGKIDLGLTKAGAKPKELALANLSVIISAANDSKKSPLGREIYEKALELKFGIKPEDLAGLGLNGLRKVALKALEGGYKNANVAKRDIAAIVKANPLARLDIINSPEAAKEILKIQELLENSPEEVQQKTDISRINVRSRDPQAGMTAEQKKIHNLVADLFMPADSRLYETNQGQGANRIRQTLLSNMDAVELIVKAKLSGQELPLGSLPGNVRAAVQGAIDQIADACIEIYRSTSVASGSQAPKMMPVSPQQAIIQCLKGETVPSQIALTIPPAGTTAAEQHAAVSKAIAGIATYFASGVPQNADEVGLLMGSSVVTVRTDGQGGVFVSIDDGSEQRIGADEIAPNFSERVLADRDNPQRNNLPDLQDGEVDGKRLEAALRQMNMSVFSQADATLEGAIDTLARDQQQILNTKLESSLQGVKQAKEEAANKGNPWDMNIPAMYAQMVTAPKGTPERAQQLAALMKEIYKGFGDLALAKKDSDDRADNEEIAFSITPDTCGNNLISQINVLLQTAGVNPPGKWFSAEGKAIYNDFFNNLATDRILQFFEEDQMEGILKMLMDPPEVPAGNAQNAQNAQNVQNGENIQNEEDVQNEGNGENGQNVQQGKQYATSYEKTVAKMLQEAKDLAYDFRPSLAQLANEAEDFDKPGMGMFTKKVLNSYFSGEVKLPPNPTQEQVDTARQVNAGREIDKRSMLAALVRYSTSGVSETAQLGAMLKGGGPLLHKLLQNFNMPGIDPDFRTALEDMKSNLAPIEPSFVQAQLLQIVQNSGGTIKNIKIDKALGAASVAQAFLVTVTPADPNQPPYKAAVKIIRPDVKVRTERELEHFKLAAEGIPGMKESYLGLYSQYQKEFDLRLEADNISKGVQIYDDGVDTDRIGTVELVDGAAPSANAMIMKLAPGESLDVYLGNMKTRLEALRNQKPRTFDELLAYKKDLRALYQELHDVNKSLGGVASKWLNKALFTAEGFFHGDLHAGNMMVKPRDPNNPESVSKITLIDYGNATALTKEQTDAIFKVNVACVFGGVYENDIAEEDKALVDRKTVEMFVSGLKALLPAEELAKFQANEAHLVNDVIRPILLRGTATEMGDRMTVLLTHLQREGIGIPGPIMNFAQSQMRLNGAMTDLESLLTGAEALLGKVTVYIVGEQMDPIGAQIDKASRMGSRIATNQFQELIAAYEYNQSPTAEQIQRWTTDATRGPNEGEDPATYQAIKQDAEKNLKLYTAAQRAQHKTELMVLLGFSLNPDELWTDKRIVDADVGISSEDIAKGQAGNYLKSPQEDPVLYAKHQEMLSIKNRIDPQVYKQFVEAEKLVTNSEGHVTDGQYREPNAEQIEQINQAKAIVTQFGQTELGKELLRVRAEITTEIKARVIQTGKVFSESFPEGNKMNNPGSPHLTKPTNLVTETLRTVNSNIGSIGQAKSFGSKMGMGIFDMGMMMMKSGDWYNYLSNTLEGLGKHSTEDFTANVNL